MRILGWDVTRTAMTVGTQATPATQQKGLTGWLATLPGIGSGWAGGVVREPYTGAWQHNQEIRTESAISFHAVYACITMIASDVSKMRLKLVELDEGTGVWSEAFSPSFSPVIEKPNGFQNRIKFFEQWIISKLIHGNTYVLKQRDQRGVVTALYILDAPRVQVLVAPDGGIYYRIGRDALSGVFIDNVTVPATEIIHDVCVPLFHPLCGVSPLTACGLAAAQGMAIQTSQARFFANGSTPGAVLSAPGHIEQETADRLKSHWEQNFSGANVGRIAVLGDGLTYSPMAMTAVDSQLLEQLQWSAATVCSCFHVPPYKIGVGPMPNQSNIEQLDVQYYTQCLQHLIENVELCLDEGLGLTLTGRSLGVEFDLEGLLRMDSLTRAETLTKLTGAGLMEINEGRAKLDLRPTKGGNAAYLQQQNYSLAALAKRDSKDDPFAKKPPSAPAPDPAATAPSPANTPAPAKSVEPDEAEIPEDDLMSVVSRTMDAELARVAKAVGQW